MVHKGVQWSRILLLTKITKLFLKFSRRIDFELHIEYEHHIRNPLSLDVDKLAEKDGISWVSKCNVPLPFSRDDVDKSEIRTALIHIVVTKKYFFQQSSALAYKTPFYYAHSNMYMYYVRSKKIT